MITQSSAPLRTRQLRSNVLRPEFGRPRGTQENWQPVGDLVSGILRSIARPTDKPALEKPVTQQQVMIPSKQSA